MTGDFHTSTIIMTRCTLPVRRSDFVGSVLTVTVSGLIGGHSGQEINKGRGNSSLLMGRALLAMASAKTGIGIEEILDAIVAKVPAPAGEDEKPLRTLIFDSYFDSYKGVIAHIRIMDCTRAGQSWILTGCRKSVRWWIFRWCSTGLRMCRMNWCRRPSGLASAR